MKTVKLTYKVIQNGNPYAQKTTSAVVSNNSNSFTQFEEKIRERFTEEVTFNHAGKTIILAE